MSSAADSPINSQHQPTQNVSAVDVLVESLEKTGLQGDTEDTQTVAQAEPPDSRPRIIYNRKQLVLLSQSPLVKLPDGMPEFKAWFGELNEQSLLALKKDSDSLTSNGNTRERRYRRELEDGDGSSRPSFRSALSQPSQMGNFKHQPLRTTDRDVGDLRSLSDRYDREKASRGDRAIPAHTLLRTRDRDGAPHPASDRDAQRTLARKRNGESKEDWRRGAELPGLGRDENNIRRDRDDRERQRSRARDASRTRASPPATRRDREDHRKDRDRDRFHEADDETKSWRDDGKREEKANLRRDKERLGREKDSEQERNHELGDNREGWNNTDEKRRNARDRRHEDRVDKREREKEKEPAWMETYVPPVTSTPGILGGKGGEGELDSIQAWKKDMKEREMKAKGLISEPPVLPTVAAQDSFDEAKEVQNLSATERPMDEIQLFKLMMKKAQTTGDGKGMPDGRQGSPNDQPRTAGSSTFDFTKVNEGQVGSSTVPGHISPANTAPSESGVGSTVNSLFPAKAGPSFKPSVSTSAVHSPSTNNTESPVASNGPRLLSLRTSEITAEQSNKDVSSAPLFDPPRTSRLLAFRAQNTKVTAQPSPQSAAAAVEMSRLQQIDPLWPNQRRTSISPVIPLSSQQTAFDKAVSQQQMLTSGQFDMNVAENTTRRSGLEPLGLNPSLYENPPRTGNSVDAGREFVELSRSSGPLGASERSGFILQSESLHQLGDARQNPTPPTANFGVTSPISPFEGQPGVGQTAYSSGKGSRMAKHFERQRDQSLSAGRNPPNTGVGANGILPHRPEQLPHNIAPGSGENRNIQDLLTMLNNSAQAQHAHFNQSLASSQPPQSAHIVPSNNPLVRHDPLLDADDGRFAPDGLVPGLRPAVPTGLRTREMGNGSLYANQMEESLAFSSRLGPQQRAGVDQVFSNQLPSQFNGHNANGARASLALQQQALRGGPSPINGFNSVQGLPQQRLPPGLANLGARPPHDPSQLLGAGAGAGGYGNVPSQLHGGLQHVNNAQAYNQFQNPSMGIVGNQAHLRGQPGLAQLGNSFGGGLNGIDLRAGPAGPLQNQMLGLNGPNIGQGMRGGPGFNAQQFPGPNHLPPPMSARQQHNLQPQTLQQLLPQQLQGIPPSQHNPNDLMALLMGNAQRE